MKVYKHLSQEERLEIYVWLRDGLSKREIARRLLRSPSTICRELKRNKASKSAYDPLFADRRRIRRLRESNSTPNKIGRNKRLTKVISQKLIEDRRSPDSISGRLYKEMGLIVSSQTIYNYIYREKPERKVFLKYKKGYRRRGIKETRGSVKPRRSIEERPKSIENRNRFGHWEIDTVRSKKSARGGLLTITERRSRYCEIEKLTTRKSHEVKAKTLLALEKYGKKKLLSITRDNGKEFALFNQSLETELNTVIYAAHPYASHERGTNEHANGMIRVFYPKGTDFNEVSDLDIENMKCKLNRKPRKILGYKTPFEVLFDERIKFFNRCCTGF